MKMRRRETRSVTNHVGAERNHVECKYDSEEEETAAGESIYSKPEKYFSQTMKS